MNNYLSNQAVFSDKPAAEWALGYPIGNGRTGAMITGAVFNERIALNHDLLWRRFFTYQDKDTAALLPEVRRLCAQGKWDEAQDLFLTKIPETGHTLYINPFVPFCDLGLFIKHKSGEIKDYTRRLDMDAGVVTVDYNAGERHYRREYFCSYPAGLFFIRLSCSAMGCLSGEVSLSRLLDPDCEADGSSAPGSVALNGIFEEGVKFAAKAKIFQKGGRLTGGIKNYTPPKGEMPPKDLNGIDFIFRDESSEFAPCGVSSCFDSADEVLIAVALATDDESELAPPDLCDNKLRALGESFPCPEALLETHKKDHRSLYRRAGLRLAGAKEGESTEAMLESAAQGEGVDNSLYSLLYGMGRYLSIASGRPQPAGTAPKSPINLQGLWNQDRRPAWDCDFHLDLNLEMCYWGQDSANLGELMQPLMDWVTRLLPQARHSAADIHGCGGVLIAATCDNKTIGNIDNIGYCFTSAAAWLAQVLWKHYEYSADINFLRADLYPFLKEIAAFYDDFLTGDAEGRLAACPSCSPEMGIAGRKKWSVLSSTSAIDLELVREVYEHLITAAGRLELDSGKTESWAETLGKLPLPPVSVEHGVCEWIENHEPQDAGHRHRSHLTGIVPGDRITVEDTPEYAEAVRKALDYRQKNGLGSSLSFSTVTDANIYARLYDAERALEQLGLTVRYNLMDNLLLSLCDWRSRGDTLAWFGGHKMFQIEAGLGLSCAIAEMIVHDRRGIIRLLPALPKKWATGSIYGICARGGFEVSVDWEEGRLKSAEIYSASGGVCRVMPFCTDGRLKVMFFGKELQTEYREGIMTFDTVSGGKYRLLPPQ